MTRQKKEFTLAYDLSAGGNKIQITAFDRALNKSAAERVVNYVVQSGETAKETPPEVSADASALQEKVNELQQRLDEMKKIKTTTVVVREPSTITAVSIVEKVRTPKKSAFYFVPYNIEKGDTLAKIAEEYLGAAQRLNFISCYNDDVSSGIIKRRNKLLVPTIDLLRMIEKVSGNDALQKIIVILAESYSVLGSKVDMPKFKEIVFDKLISSGLLAKDAKVKYRKNEFMVNKDIIVELKKGAGINKAHLTDKLNKNNRKYALVASFSENYLELQIAKK